MQQGNGYVSRRYTFGSRQESEALILRPLSVVSLVVAFSTPTSSNPERAIQPYGALDGPFLGS